jgi:hypothetical protein
MGTSVNFSTRRLDLTIGRPLAERKEPQRDDLDARPLSTCEPSPLTRPPEHARGHRSAQPTRERLAWLQLTLPAATSSSQTCVAQLDLPVNFSLGKPSLVSWR